MDEKLGRVKYIFLGVEFQLKRKLWDLTLFLSLLIFGDSFAAAAPALACLNHFKDISFWVSTTILMGADEASRVKVLAFMTVIVPYFHITLALALLDLLLSFSFMRDLRLIPYYSDCGEIYQNSYAIDGERRL